jgi:flagellar basal body-associated protein FliL
MAEKPEKPAKEEPAEKSGGGSNMPIVAAVMLMGLLNVGAIGGLGYFMVTKMQAIGTASAGAKPAGGHGAEGGEGEAGDGDHGGGGDDHGGGGDHAAAGGDDHGDGGDDHGDGGKKGAHGPPGVVQTLQNIVVRLKDVEREHHARISLALEFKATAEKAGIEASLPRVREATITYASDRRYDEMRGSRGLLDLKKFLNKKARELYGADFSELYVTEFVAQ